MLFSRFTKVSLGTFFLLTALTLMLAASAVPAAAQRPAATLQTLLDRAQIEDLLVDYYGQLGTGGHGFSDYYVEDSILDVNGIIGKGKQGIEDLYKKVAAGSPSHAGAIHMLLTNVKIVVKDDTATADVIWTGVSSETVKAVPQVFEQGREHDELVKRNGQWYFQHRVITADGGMPAMYDKTYTQR